MREGLKLGLGWGVMGKWGKGGMERGGRVERLSTLEVIYEVRPG